MDKHIKKRLNEIDEFNKNGISLDELATMEVVRQTAGFNAIIKLLIKNGVIDEREFVIKSLIEFYELVELNARKLAETEPDIAIKVIVKAVEAREEVEKELNEYLKKRGANNGLSNS